MVVFKKKRNAEKIVVDRAGSNVGAVRFIHRVRICLIVRENCRQQVVHASIIAIVLVFVDL